MTRRPARLVLMLAGLGLVLVAAGVWAARLGRGPRRLRLRATVPAGPTGVGAVEDPPTDSDVALDPGHAEEAMVARVKPD